MPSPHGGEEQARLVEALQDPRAYGGAIAGVTLLETHISYVLLTGHYAYKIKKAVTLPFLDASTLEARRRYCRLELALNRRLAPAIYLDVVQIAGTPDQPIVGGEGPPIEYAVKMREFPQEAVLSRMLIKGSLRPEHIDALAARVARFHQSIDVAPPDGPFGRPEEVLQLALENFAQTRPLLAEATDISALRGLQDWTLLEFEARRSGFVQRRLGGSVRECHGDLHLGNIALIGDEVTVFDCIEFNEAMRWIDVMSETAFTMMDLEDRRRRDLAFRFLAAYLERTGDYEGTPLLRFYEVYRAMVRAKVAAIRRAQIGARDNAGKDGETDLLGEYRTCVKLAEALTRSGRKGLVIMSGPSGSGKTTCSQALLESLGAVRVRTDVERKRLHGLAYDARTASPLGEGLYSADATDRTYRTVSAAARHVVDAGYPAIVDGSFLSRDRRDMMRRIAADLRIPFVIVACTAPPAVLQLHVSERAARGSDASEADLAVLEHQLSTLDELSPDEVANAVVWNAAEPIDDARDAVARLVGERLGR